MFEPMTQPHTPTGWQSFRTLPEMIKAYQVRKLEPCQKPKHVVMEDA